MTHTDRIGHNTKFHRSDDGTSGGNFATVGIIRDLVPPNLTRQAEDSTDMESEERWSEFIGGMRDAGEVSFDITLDPASAETTAFMADLSDDDPGYYKIVFPDATEWGFSALMIGFDGSVPVATKMTVNVTFKVSGKPGFIA